MFLSRYSFFVDVTPEKTIMAARLVVCTLIALVITTYFNIVEPIWVFITLFVVLFEQNTIGASLNRSAMRAIATLSSALFSLIIIVLFHNNYLMNLLGVILGIFSYTYLFGGTKNSYIATLGCVTLSICLINYNDVSHLFIRASNVTIGILIALFASRFFLPSRATQILVVQIQKILTQYADLSTYITSINDTTTDSRENLQRFQSNVVKLILNYQKFLDEADVEIRKESQFTQIAADILQSFRYIYYSYNSITVLLLVEKMKINESDKEILIFLSAAVSKLKDNLSQLRYEHKLVTVTDMRSKDDKNLLTSMLHFIVLEHSSLETKINKFIDVLKTVKLQ